MICNTQLYRGGDAQSFMHTAEIVVHDVKCQGGGVERAVL